jgi:hypothetical protein
MHLINWLINKLFLVKEIRSKEGALHFRRWRFFTSPWFRIYLHKICRSDEDKHLHTHPWNFISFILKGGYSQEYWDSILDRDTSYQRFGQFDLVKLGRHEGHKITLSHTPTWTLVFAYGGYKEWGYLTERGYIDHKNYRQMKNNGELND